MFLLAIEKSIIIRRGKVIGHRKGDNMLIYDGRERIMIFCCYRFAYGILLAIDYGF